MECNECVVFNEYVMLSFGSRQRGNLGKEGKSFCGFLYLLVCHFVLHWSFFVLSGYLTEAEGT